jgi:uncharacterized membrane protein
VHFPIALLVAGLAPALVERRRPRPELAFMASWLLWLGTAAAWAAVVLGLVAEAWARHVPASWEAMADHKAMGIWTAAAFTVLSLWRWRFSGKGGAFFPLAWLTACVLLFATAYEGGELVFSFGVGVENR